MDAREQRLREMVRRVKRDYSALLKPGREMVNMIMAHETDEMIRDLARDGSKEALKIARHRIRHWQKEARERMGREGAEQRYELPAALNELAVEIFAYGEPKARPGRGATYSLFRSISIAIMVKVVGESGFPIRTPEDQRDDPNAPMSACRLVGEELGLDERTVERIWDARKEVVTKVNAASFSGERCGMTSR